MILTEALARMRTRLIQKQSIKYKFLLNLKEGNYYEGYAQILFKTTDAFKNDQSIFLDFCPKAIIEITINHVKVDEISRNGKLVFLDRTLLKVHQQNIIQICYQSEYDNDSNGLISFKDKVGLQYLYTIFQPYNANRVFPVFDQPNLKSIMNLIVITPSCWTTVISNQFPVSQMNFQQTILHNQFPSVKNFSIIQEIMKRKDKPIITIFKQTCFLPPHVFCINAGPYKEIKLDSKQLNIPMRLFSSQPNYHLLLKIKPLIQEITIESMLFFNKFFGYCYPFSKYDQIFPGQYEKVAMENCSSSIFTDSYLHDPNFLSNQNRFWMFNTMTHQLAHHWFGNLVTAQWWEDLWLHEGFAQFFGFYCLQKIKERLSLIKIQSSMSHFIQTREMAFIADNGRLALPVHQQNQNISKAIANFQALGIAYTKGASILYQLLYIIGQQNYCKVLQIFLNRFAYKNAKVLQFFEIVKEYWDEQLIGIQLSRWKQQWLDTNHYNILQCQKSQNQYTVCQKSDRNQLKRCHKIALAFIASNLNIHIQEYWLKKQEKLKIKIPHDTAAIISNYNCYSYLEDTIDKSSLQFMLNHYQQLDDNLIKSQIWQFMLKEMKNSRITADQYISTALKYIYREQSDIIYQRCLKSIVQAFNYLNTKQVNQYKQKIFDQLVYNAPKQSPNRKLIISQMLVNFVNSQKTMNVLLDWVYGQCSALQHIPISYNTKWKIIKEYIVKTGKYEKIQKLTNKLFEQDPSDRALLQIEQIKAMRCSKQQVFKLYNSFKDQECQDSVTVKKAKISGWANCPHKQQHHKCSQNFAKDVIEAKNSLKNEHYDLFVNYLYPSNLTCQQKIKQLEQIEIKGDQFMKQQIDIQNLFQKYYRSQC